MAIFREVFESASGVNVPRTDMEAIVGNQVYLKPKSWKDPWAKLAFPDLTRYGEHVRAFCKAQGATDGEGTQLWGIPEDWMVVTTPAGWGAGHEGGHRRKAWHLLLPGEIMVPAVEFIADLIHADVKPSFRDEQGQMKAVFWSYWNGLSGVENLILLTAEGLSAADHRAQAIVQVSDLLEAWPQRGQKGYNDFLASVHAKMTGAH